MKQFIIEEFKQLNVVDEAVLVKYIDYCLEHALTKRIKFETQLHHILPKAKTLPFSAYKDLTSNPWNGVHLTHYDHFIAHSLLVKSVNDKAIAHGWFRMSNMLTQFDPNIYAECRLLAAKSISESLVGRRLSEEHREKISNVLLGRPVSIETREAISKSNLGKNRSEEHREKLRQANIGKKTF